MKRFLILSLALTVIACAKLPAPQCTATALIGNQETTVQIYGVKKVANQTQYWAGNPFNWRWVPKTNFTSSTCEK